MKFLKLLTLLSLGTIILSGFHPLESPLSALMRSMGEDMKKLKVRVQQGESIPKFPKRYQKIHTAKPSADAKKGERYTEYATIFLAQCERTYSAPKEKLTAEYNNLVQACIHCHETYCPGPLGMLRKLKIPQ